MKLPRALYTADQVRQLDSVAINEFEIPGLTLMTTAGDAVFRVLIEHYCADRVVVVCGIGNNAGDGYVVARLLNQHGYSVDVLQLGDESRIQGDALQAKQAMEQAGLRPQAFAGDKLPDRRGVVVDAIFGTGLEREVTGEWAAAIEAINGSGAAVVAVDIPSGLHADSGNVLGVAVRADHTVTFIGLKLGMFTQNGRDYCGQVVFHDLHVPHEVYACLNPAAQRLAWDNRRMALPRRAYNVHKGNFGHVLTIGGDVGMPGAICLASQAAARVGAGLVSVATRAEHAVPLVMSYPVLMAHAVEDSGALQPLLAKASVLAVGPGLGQGDWGQTMLHLALQSKLPLVVDADGLNLLAQRQDHRRDNWVLTPHPLEAARLLGTTTASVQADRLGAVRIIAQRYGGVCLLKGAGTLISNGEQTLLCDAGSGVMATGGMGDVLTGIIAGLLAQYPEQFSVDLIALAALLHAHCADSRVQQGYARVLATDVLDELVMQMKEI